MLHPVLAEEATPPGGAPPQAAEPKPDPAGISTGDKTNVIDAGGNSFAVSEPSDEADPDYAKKKKDFEVYQTQAGKEPLATKLADAVGHLRLATNFSWTLFTGYLVLFMQAGFALLTCGLVRKKNAAHLMMLNFAAYVFAFLAYYACGFAFQFGAVAVNAAPTNLGGTPTLNEFLLGSGQWGFLGGKGFFLSGPGYDAGSNVLRSSKSCLWRPPAISSSAPSASASHSGRFFSANFSWAPFFIPCSAAGSGAAAGCRSWAPR